ncbi:hypothetical protein METBIDRAFT_112376 [Metschnikowia bicuspidata var. bicuspidata NRRL YB-4993]|uniref:Uncharacterized protein n=1 Tax=Metschnikowia bicuspidata var. bicuspidata NRRL YB-4993 TaxID=869754 RepID=A0A1A0HID5_9ASCO|nr:hypothetical protein METBIDRAFT_112376 [Metschnikowia bicuspidata var. bicuspidata NRRL YB-4993]OBA23761.1 hypothetical protein METBIDRAFT_112376 [Metschnikowia bicuspidata var. bicuspidata NRRL YB-4993]
MGLVSWDWCHGIGVMGLVSWDWCHGIDLTRCRRISWCHGIGVIASGGVRNLLCFWDPCFTNPDATSSLNGSASSLSYNVLGLLLGNHQTAP